MWKRFINYWTATYGIIPRWVMLILPFFMVTAFVGMIFILFGWPLFLLGFWPYIHTKMDSTGYRILFFVLILIMAAGVYTVRFWNKGPLGMIEIVLGLVSVWVATGATKAEPLRFLFVLVAGIFLLFRGVDDMIESHRQIEAESASPSPENKQRN